VTPVRLKYLHHFEDRHGHSRWYFRRHGKRVPLDGLPGSDQFMVAYHAAMAGQRPDPIGAIKMNPGTIHAAVSGYFQSAAFRALSVSTQRTYRGVLETFRAQNGGKPIALLERRHIHKMLSDKADTPHAANNLLKRLRNLMAWAVTEGLVAAEKNPTIGLKNLRLRSDGFRVWDENHLAQYRAKHPLGTRARLAVELLVNTGLRRSDIVRLGRQHVRDGVISIKLQKTGAQVDITLLPDLQTAIDSMPSSAALTFLLAKGKPFTAAGFGGWFRERCDDAGIPVGYAAHGLRKLAATRLADRGATAHELKAWFGWKSLRQAEVYTESVDRKRLSAEAGKKRSATSSGKP
jgi:integrase